MDLFFIQTISFHSKLPSLYLTTKALNSWFSSIVHKMWHVDSYSKEMGRWYAEIFDKIEMNHFTF